jgi:hypothetical protein
VLLLLDIAHLLPPAKTTWRCHSAAPIDDLAAFSGVAPREVVDQSLTFERFNPHIPETFLK